MGCDGGTIPTRDEMVRLKKKPEQKDKTADLAAKWKHCSITQEQLREPIMACELGRLYNKEAVLEFLIDRSKFECASSFEHLRGLKDVKELQLTKNKNYSQPQSEKGDGYIDRQDSLYICPVVGLEMNGMYKFSFVWGCGCVLSERALKEVKGDECHKCGKPFTQEDAIILNGTDEDIDHNAARMNEKRLQQKLMKKAKKAAKQKCETATSSSTDGPSTSKQTKLSQPETDTKLTNGGAKRSKRSDIGKSKLINGTNVRGVGAISETVKKGGSIQKNPDSSAAYKSLFTSSDRAKNQQSAHWVTSNPYWM